MIVRKVASALAIASVLLVFGWWLPWAMAQQPRAPADRAAGDVESDGEAPAVAAAAPSLEQLVERCRASVVVMNGSGRDGKSQGIGTGFVVAADGLIATNLHVIGEGRPVRVQLADGRQLDVTSIHASDRTLDLALVRVDAGDLAPLELGDSDALVQGRPVFALGNPLGWKYSVTSGVVSATRVIDGQPMIQVAMPVEPGNSGGPLLDLEGKVQGILSMKSQVTANLGFAVAINSLKSLLARPNPVPMDRWLSLGALDPAEWSPRFGARWRRRPGRVVVDGVGDGFGGRSLCLSTIQVPQSPYELAVTVRLDDEAGAAGLIFASDGEQRHYGFYPSGARLRLTRFAGPDVSSWTILAEEESSHYRPGEWNRIKVRREPERTLCYVNDALVIESTDTTLREGLVGLAKFRDTQAQFKEFRVADKLPAAAIPQSRTKQFAALLGDAPSVPDEVDAHLAELLEDPVSSVTLLRERALKLAQYSVRLRELAADVRHRAALAALEQAMQAPDDQLDLVHAAMLIASLDDGDLDVAAYRQEIDRMGRELAETVADSADETARRMALAAYLFEQNGFHGSRTDYYNRANSYLNRVLDDREGLPLTLSILYMELARRIGLNVVGIGLPGHFVVEHRPAGGPAQLLDVFDSARPLSRDEAAQKVLAASGQTLTENDFQPASRRAILARLLHNLLAVAREAQDGHGMLRYSDALVVVTPDDAGQRWVRAVLRFQSGDAAGARQDTAWLLDRRPEGIDLDRVAELHQLLERQSE